MNNENICTYIKTGYNQFEKKTEANAFTSVCNDDSSNKCYTLTGKFGRMNINLELIDISTKYCVDDIVFFFGGYGDVNLTKIDGEVCYSLINYLNYYKGV